MGTEEEPITDEEGDVIIAENLSKFKNYALLGTLTSFACLLSVIGQFLFNAFSQYKLPFDKWAICELLNAITNTVVYNIFNSLTPQNIRDENMKQYLNWA